MNVFELYAKVSVNRSQAVNDIRAVETAGKQASTQMGAGFQKLGDNVGKWIKRGAVVAAAAIAALGATSISNFAKLDTKMREVFTLMPGLSETAKTQMIADVKDVAREIGVLPNEVVPALYQAISAGVPQDNVFEFMKIAGKAAKGGVTDLETAVDALSSVVNAYGADVISATEASDHMFTAVRLGKTNLEQLAKSLFQVTPIAAAVGVNFGQVAAAMAEITAKGVPTNVAATQLRQMLVELTKAGGETAIIFEELSGKSFQDFMDEGNDLADVLALLQEYADANNLSMQDMFTSVEGGMAALSLGGSNIDTFRAKLGEMADDAGATDQAFAEMAAGIQFRLDQLAAWWQTVQINIGEELEAGLSQFLGWLEANQEEIERRLLAMFRGLLDGLQWIIDHQGAIKVALTVIAVGLGAILAVTHPLLAGLGLITAALVYLMARQADAARAAEEHAKFLAQLENEAEGAADAIEKTDDALRSMREGAEGVTEAIRDQAESIQGTKDELWAFAGVIVALQFKLRDLEKSLNAALGMEYRDSPWKGIFDVLISDVAAALQDARDEGDGWQDSAIANVNAVLDAYSLAYPELSEYLSTYAITMADVAAETDSSLGKQLSAYEQYRAGMEVYYKWKAEKEAAAAASSRAAFANVILGVEAVAGSISSVAEKIETAYNQLTGDTEATAEEIQESWGEIASGVAAGANSFLDSISDMYRTNRELKKEHDEKMLTIEEGAAEGLLDAATSRDDTAAAARARAAEASESEAARHAAALERIQRTYDDKIRRMDADDAEAAQEAAFIRNRSLQDAEEEHAAKMATITEDMNEALTAAQEGYTSDTLDLNQQRVDAIDDETEAYEEARITIGEILKEMATNLLTAIREELMLQAAKYAIMAVAAALNPLTWGFVAGYALQAAALTAGAVGLAIAGFAKGGITTVATLGMVGEAGIPEGVIPLTMKNLSAIGRAIASASGFSAAPLSAAGIPGLTGGSGADINIGGGAYPEAGGGGFRGAGAPGGAVSVSVHFEGDVSIRDDSDIDKLVEGIEDSFGRTRRSLGFAGAT